MNLGLHSDEVRVGLAYVGLKESMAAVLEHLAFARIRATFFVPPDELVQDTIRWSHAVDAGHELGNGALLGVTDDGRLPNWDFDAVDGDLHEADRLLADLGMASVDSVFLPGHFHVCGDGRYRQRVQQKYPVCLSDSLPAVALRGSGNSLAVLGPGVRTRLTGTSVVVVKGDPDLAAHSRMLVRLAKYATGPARLLSEPT